MSSFSARSKALALLPKFTGLLSFMGSSFILQDIVLHKSAHRVYHRVVLGLSASDIFASIVNVLSTWPTPEGTPGVWLASGTTGTCTAQGFFNELGNLSTPLYNFSLCLYYVLVIRNAWTEDQIRSKAEPLMHAVPILAASLISIIGLPLNLYNNAGWLCWIAVHPAGCLESDTCTRGQHANTFRWIHYAIIWSSIACTTVGMYMIYSAVKSQETKEGQQLGLTPEEVKMRCDKSKKVASQGMLFVGALYITWFFTTVARIYQIATGRNHFVLLLLMAIFFPLQGFFNCIIYLRPRYLWIKCRRPHASTLQLMRLTLYPEDHSVHDLPDDPDDGGDGTGATEAGPAGDARGPGGMRGRRGQTSYFYSMSSANLTAPQGANDDDDEVAVDRRGGDDEPSFNRFSMQHTDHVSMLTLLVE